MSVSDAKIQELKNYVYNEFLVDNVDVDYEKCTAIYDCLSELQMHREMTGLTIETTLQGGEEE